MDILDLIDIQRVKHPKLRKYSYESKTLKVKSRIDFFLVAKHLEQYVKKCEIYSSVAPDHKTIYISLSCSLRSWRDFVRECFCFGSEAVNASGEAVRGLVKSRVEFPPAQISGVF